MKRQNKIFWIIILILALGWSLLLNYLQGVQVNKLQEAVRDMEYIQSALSDELERVSDSCYGEEL